MENKNLCQYCNKEFASPKAKASHQQHCPDYLKIKKEAEAEWRKTKHYCSVCGTEITKFRYQKNKLNTCDNKECIKKAKDIHCTEISRKNANDPDFQKRREENSLKKYGVPHPQSLQSVKDKIKKTCQEKYGGDSALCSAEVRKKGKQTMLEKYGVENYQNSPELMAKAKKTNLEKYGTEYTFQAESVKAKIKKTEQERYGGNHQNNPEIKAKIKKTNQERYGVDTPLQSKEVWETYKKNYKENHGVDHPSQDTIVIEKKWKTKRTKHFEKFKSLLSDKNLEVLFDLEYYNSIPKIKDYSYKCLTCNQEFTLKKSMILKVECPYCSQSFRSRYEKQVYDFLLELGLTIEQIKTNNRFIYTDDSQYPKELDIYLPDYKFAIEIDGLYYHYEKDQNYHLEKTEACEKQDIQLIHITDSEWELKQDICKSIIKQYLNKTDTTLYARDCSVLEVPNNQYQDFCNQNHIQGFTPAKYRLGLYYGKQLVQIASFGKSRFTQNETELLRSCTLLNTRVIGGLSKLISHFVNIYKPENLITYCDRRWFSGKGYSATGWELISKTQPNYWYFSLDEYYLQSRMKFQKHKLNDLLEEFNPELSESQNMEINGFLRFYDCGSLKFKYTR